MSVITALFKYLKWSISSVNPLIWGLLAGAVALCAGAFVTYYIAPVKFNLEKKIGRIGSSILFSLPVGIGTFLIVALG